MMWLSNIVAAMEQRAHSISRSPRNGLDPFSGAISTSNAKHAVDDGRYGVEIGKREPLRTKSGTKAAWVWRGLEMTSIFVAITLANIGLVKLLDGLLDAVHH